MKLTSDVFVEGQVIRQPVGCGNGYWAGAPGAFFAADEGAWYLTYRIRRPRGVDPDRGGEARIARSTDLENWTDIWSVNKAAYNSASIERSAIRKGPDKLWSYFTSFVHPSDGRWCVAVLKAREVAKLEAADARIVFTGQALGLEGVKDPWILEDNGRYWMFLSVALPTAQTTGQSHSTSDIYNTGECVSASGLASSDDLEHWQWKGIVFVPEKPGWDKYCRRINSVIRVGTASKYLALYDGSASHLENYEEKTGVATSTDLVAWKSLSSSKPFLTSPHCSGSLRYMDVQIGNSELCAFYELALQDGSHDLRVLKLPEAQIGAVLPN